MKTKELEQMVSPIMEKYGVAKAQIFGSFARGDFLVDSDIDILVSFIKPLDGWTFASLARELEEALKRKVDLVTEGSLSEYFKPYVLPSLVDLYAKRT